MEYYGIESQLEEVRNWYNGYIFGNTVVYNPWSVLQYTQNWEEGLQPYWINTSDNELVKRLITKGGYELKSELEDLLQGGSLLNSLTSGEIKTFAGLFKDYVMASLSYFDTGGQEPEQFYHAFVLGLLVGLRPEYEVKSNRESGYGRYDIMIIPCDLTKIGVIIEFKKVDVAEGENLDKAAERALQQIEAKGYQQELLDRGIHKIIKLGIVFRGKEVLVKAGE